MPRAAQRGERTAAVFTSRTLQLPLFQPLAFQNQIAPDWSCDSGRSAPATPTAIRFASVAGVKGCASRHAHGRTQWS